MLRPPPAALRRRVHTDVEVRDPVRRRGYHIDGGLRGEAVSHQNVGVEVVDAISTVAPLLVRAEGSRRRFRVRHQPVNPWLLCQPADV